MEEVQVDKQRQEKAKEYARINRRLMVVDMALGLLYAIAWLFAGWSEGLKQFLLNYTSNPWLLTPAFAAVFAGIYMILNLPLSYYSSFVLPHRFGQSNETIKGWISDQIKGLLVGAVLGVIVLEVLYAVLRAYPVTWWLWAGAFLLFFSVILSNLAPVLLFPIFYKFELLSDERQDLAERLKRLAEQAGAHVRGVYKFDMSRRTKSANAALTGLGNTRRVILGDTLLNEFSDDEIETVLAHELGHHINHDIPLGIAFETLTTLLGLYLASLALNWGTIFFGFNDPGDIAAFPFLLLVMGAYGLVTMPLGNAFSRWREQKADDYALKVTRKPQAFASAMTRLANQNLADADPEPWVVFLLYSHPPIRERVAKAEGFAG